MGVPQSSSEHRRISAIDAARGSAMLFVFFSHFVEVFFRRHDVPVGLSYLITMIASPAFIVISGLMLGVLYQRRKDDFGETKSRFIRRGFFLITVGRLLIYLAHVPFAGGWEEALRWGFMTDTIGVCIILGPVLMPKLSSRSRLGAGILLIGLSWVALQTWTPAGTTGVALKELFIGPFAGKLRFFADVFPVLPWLGLYLAATSLGEFLGKLLKAQGEEGLGRMVCRFGLGCIGIAVGVVLLRHLLQRMDAGLWGAEALAFFSPFQKLPPSPVYFLFYGGCALIMLALLLKFRHVRPVGLYIAAAEVLGRTSLFVFIVQYFVYFSVFVW
ncbi:MAG: DUF1624 domain-containing protein, partial [Bacteroidetes bacterium]|nr:DUF1624 domain-containing protein [Bacteroidota bacterium]